ncbi:MAG TPA: SDR family oxidoreductase, partial [Alphaproteobacteria bacterium]|nr:SDR family oxidoreductase [Alphaproteobacteria bacterium]
MTPPRRTADGDPPAAALRGLVCLITGASGTLGSAIARHMRREGADLVLVGRSSERLAKLAERLAAEGGGTGGIELATVDLAAPDAAERAAAAVSRRGRLDVLVNNAAIQGPIGPLWENDWAAWEETIRVDLMAPIALCRALVGFLAKARRGKIINISGGGASGPRANFSAYAVAKTGLVRFTETFAEEVRARNIDVNAVAPGPLASDMTERILAAGAALSGAREIAAAEKAKSGEAPAALDKAAALC